MSVLSCAITEAIGVENIPMIIFENSGEIDPQLISLIGVNVKESESAIGYFGTGLKYAIACLARWGEVIIHISNNLEIYEGESNRIFYRGIAVQKLEKPSCYTYNIIERLYLTEDRTCGSWQSDPIIARGLAEIKDCKVIDATLTAPASKFESRLDYDYVSYPGEMWKSRAEHFALARPMEIPSSVRDKFIAKNIKYCPTCNRPM